MLIDEIDWTPVVAVRGLAMLIEVHRIGLYAQIEYKSNARFWAVCYLIFSHREYEQLQAKMENHPPFEYDITYDDDQQSECATISRAYLASRRMAGDEVLHFVGFNLPWRETKYATTEIQEALLKFHVWTKACIAS